MRNKIHSLVIILMAISLPAKPDTIPTGFSRPAEWRISTEISPAWVPGTNSCLRGENLAGKVIDSNLTGTLRMDFSFNPETREGLLYKEVYQGVGIDINTFHADNVLGTPVSLYIYQGAPIAHLSKRLWLGYEWQFGAAFGWKHSNRENAEQNTAVSTSVTAHMGIGLKLHYDIDGRWRMMLGVNAKHYSNGNTSYSNAGVNTIGATVGLAYTINPQKEHHKPAPDIEQEADRRHWFYDIMAYVALRKRIVYIGEYSEPQLCNSVFGIAGLQFAPMYRLNRWVAVGPAANLQWDESAGLAPYMVTGNHDEGMKFMRPPFHKQIKAGLSAHAELTMPVFSLNAGIGYDIINPQGDKRFYQSLALKTFITRRFFLNVGYRLGNFNEPQNLMIGAGIRL